MRFLLIPLAVQAFATSGASAQSVEGQLYDAAYYAWDEGRYPEALRGFERLLTGSGGDDYLERIALITGERFRTVEIAPDGTNPTWSPDGRYATYQTPSGGGLVTRIVTVEEGRVRTAGELTGGSAVFSPDGRAMAFLVLDESSARTRALAAIRRRIQVRSRADMMRARREMARVNARFTRIMVRELESAEEHRVPTPGLAVFEVAWGLRGETLYVIGAAPDDTTRTDVYELTRGAAARRLTTGGGLKADLTMLSEGRALFTGSDGSFGVLNLATGESETMHGSSAVVSRDGSTIAFTREAEGETSIHVWRIRGSVMTAFRTTHPIDNLALSPNGNRVVFQINPRENWELMLAHADGTGAKQLTHDVQHDLFPRFLSDDVILAVMGEGRHRRSYLYDADTGERKRLFHNNTIRTVAPEYEWAASPDGTKVMIVSERDGDTISPERGVYLVDLSSPLSKADILARIRTNLARETRLRERGTTAFLPIADSVAATVALVGTGRIYDYAKDLFAFGSKFITQPGNAMAVEYIAAKLRSFGYEPELQWFEPRPGLRSANVIATLPGTVNPDLTYVVSSHFDSVERGPGADDNSSGTTALLEAARVLADRPQPATIHFAFFTGEEAGLLGSREYVRRAVASGVKIVGALNNDMVGYANTHQLDNTVRYSNEGIRDIQHAAAFLFTDLITYDAKYYKSTDAHAYYEAYGDIVGGIGSYPILANPHYHQTHDVLETINQQLVAEVSKTTVATLMLLASSPSRLTGVETTRTGRDVAVSWAPAVESDVERYVVWYGPDESVQSVETSESRVRLSGVLSGTSVRVKAVNRRGLQGWDWAHVVVP